jgi:hypothetical protein
VDAPGRREPHADAIGARTPAAASTTSSSSRARFSTVPPYRSSRRFVPSSRNWSSRYPFAPWTSTPSKPAALAFSAARRNCPTMPGVSSSLSARGVSSGTCRPEASMCLPGAATAEGATGTSPPGRIEECDIRPVCQIWRTISPPFAWTASVTSRQPATCSSE